MSRIRAFYPQTEDRPALCVKILEVKNIWMARAVNEIKQRCLLEELNTLLLPRITSHGLIGDYIYIAEEMIEGRRFSFRRDRDLFIHQALPELISTYQKAGVSKGPITDYFVPNLPQNLLEIDDTNKDYQHIASILTDTFNSGSLLDISLCHGDLVPSNLCRFNNKIYFLDWDASGRSAIIPDLLRLVMKYPSEANSMLHAIRKALRPVIKENPAPVFTATVARRMVNMPKQRKALLALWKHHYPYWQKM